MIRKAFWNPWRGSLAARWQFWSSTLSRHGIPVDNVGDNLRTFSELFTDVHRRFATRKNATIWGDKSPNYYDCMTTLAKDFWNAKFIVVSRDPLGTANAISRAAKADAPYFKKRGIYLRALLGFRVLQRQCDQLLAEGRDVCQINYEDLAREPEVAMRKVCNFLDIPFMAEVATLQNADRSSVPGGTHHALLRGETILAEARPSVIDPVFRDKIVRYKNWWNMRQSGTSGRVATQPFAKLSERLWDGVGYQALRTFDAITRLSFSLLPLSWLIRYRKFRFRGRPGGNEFNVPSRKGEFVHEL